MACSFLGYQYTSQISDSENAGAYGGKSIDGSFTRDAIVEGIPGFSLSHGTVQKGQGGYGILLQMRSTASFYQPG